MKKLLAFMLCLCLMLTVFAGGFRNTASADSEDEAQEEMTEAASAADAEAVEEETDPAADAEAVEEESDPDADAEAVEEETAPAVLIGLGGTGYETYAPDTVVGTVNGSEVPWVEYYYWLSYYVSISEQLPQIFGMEVSGWDSQELYIAYYMAAVYGYLSLNLPAYGLTEESTNAEIVTALAQTSVLQYHAVQTGMEDLGVTLSEEDIANLQSYVDQNADMLEGVGDGDGVASEEELAAFRDYLETELEINLDFFNFMNTVSTLENNGFVSMYGMAGEGLSDEDAVAFAADHDIMSAKHILLLTVDPETGESLTEDEIAQKLDTAETLLEELKAEEDQEARIALFDELTAEYTEDSGYISYPDGYIFTVGEMVTEFEDAVRELDENYGISDIVESSYGYHIILRTPVDPDGIMASYGATLRNVAAAELFYNMEDEWFANAEVEWNEGFEEPDLAAIFG